MLKERRNLPSNIKGIEASGTITKSDYEKTLRPMIEAAHKVGKPIRFLYCFGKDFEAFTAGAAWEDLTLGLKYLALFERCAVVTDKDWIRNTMLLMAPFLPCPLRVFATSELNAAESWLGEASLARNIDAKLIPDQEIVIAEVTGPLEREDFNYLAAQVDPWIEQHHSLRGIVLHAKKFPGWENLGSFFRHVEFVGMHHQKVSRIAVSADGVIPEMVPQLAKHFINAEVKQFGYNELGHAEQWAAGK